MSAHLLELGVVSIFGLSGLLLAVLAYVVYNYRDARGTRYFVVLLVLMSVWSLSAAIKIVAPRPVEYGLVSLEIVYGVLFAISFFVFASAYTGRDWHRSRWLRAGASALVAVVLVALVTNSSHGLLWDVTYVSTGGFPHLAQRGKGWLYYTLIALAYLLYVVGIYFLLDLHLRSNYRSSTLMLVIGGGLMPLLVNLVSLFDWAPIPSLDYTPFGLAIFGLATTAAINRDLFAIVPVARATAVEYSSEGMVILDSRRHIRDYNPVAEQLLPGLVAHEGDHISRVVDEDKLPFDEAESRTDLTLGTGSHERHVAVRLAPISTAVHDLGWTMAVTDITDQKRREHHLDLVARVLRHNMSNEITVIKGKVDILRQHVDDEAADHLDTIEESSDHIITTSDKLRTLQEIVLDDRGSYSTHVPSAIDLAIERVERDFPDATISYSGLEVWAECRSGLVEVIQNLVENGLTHNESDEPRVEIDVTATESHVNIVVTDNGTGLPPNERRILEEGETPIRHGSGVGLWLVYRFVELSGGTLAFDINPHGGSIVDITLPRAYPDDGE